MCYFTPIYPIYKLYPHLLTIDPKFQEDIQVSSSIPGLFFSSHHFVDPGNLNQSVDDTWEPCNWWVLSTLFILGSKELAILGCPVGSYLKG